MLLHKAYQENGNHHTVQQMLYKQSVMLISMTTVILLNSETKQVTHAPETNLPNSALGVSFLELSARLQNAAVLCMVTAKSSCELIPDFSF